LMNLASSSVKSRVAASRAGSSPPRSKSDLTVLQDRANLDV
jgi:hypothetical protein